MGGKNKKDSNQIWAGGAGAQWLIKIIDYVQSGREWLWPSLLKITIHQHLHSEYRPPQLHKQRLGSIMPKLSRMFFVSCVPQPNL